MRYAILLLTAALICGGCASSGPRVALLTGAETAKLLYTASAQAYGQCHAEAEGLDEATECWMEKNARGEQIGQALPLLHSAGEALITYDLAKADPNLRQAQAILRALMPALSAYLTNEQQQAVGWIEL